MLNVRVSTPSLQESGDDRIFGNAEISEIFDAGDGYNQISAGDSDESFDWVDYRNVGQAENNPAEGLNVAVSTNSAGKGALHQSC